MKDQTFIIRNKEIRTEAARVVMSITGDPLMEVIIRKHKKRRSSQANAFYWGCVVEPLAQHIGYTKGEMHEEILGAYVGWEEREFMGRKRYYPRRASTTPEPMDTMDFKGLIETGQRIAATLGVRLPDETP